MDEFLDTGFRRFHPLALHAVDEFLVNYSFPHGPALLLGSFRIAGRCF